MRDLNILSYVGRSLWALTEDKWAEMVPALIRHAKGDKLDAEQLQAFMGGREDKPVTSSKRGAVAIVPIRGVIAHRMDAMSMSSGGASCEGIKAMLESAFAEASVGTILLDVDSPGGTVTGCQELAAWLHDAKAQSGKKVVAIANGLMASAAYWIASQADEIVSIPSGDVGSIGVYSVHQDLSEHLKQEGITITAIKAGKYKFEGNPFEPLSDEAKAVMQARVDAAYGEFTKAVARGRGVEASAVKGGYGEGRVLKAKDAKAAGLIDRIGTMDETLSRLTGARSKAAGMRAEGMGLAVNVLAEPVGCINADSITVEAMNDRTSTPPAFNQRVLAGIPGHAHALDKDGNLTCGCEWPTEVEAVAEAVEAIVARVDEGADVDEMRQRLDRI
jgi:signal peptide peptidase SppA